MLLPGTQARALAHNGVAQLLKTCRRDVLGQSVGELLLSADLLDGDDAALHLLLGEMVLDVDVAGPLRISLRVGQSDAGRVVLEDGGGLQLR